MPKVLKRSVLKPQKIYQENNINVSISFEEAQKELDEVQATIDM